MWTWRYSMDMAASLHRLTARQVEGHKKPGRLADGGGLYLRVTPAGTRTWVFRSVVNGKQVEVALGLASGLTLASARQRAAEMRQHAAEGQPLRVADKRDAISAAAMLSEAHPSAGVTFGVFAEEYIASVEAGWRNPIHRQQWRQTLRDHAALLTERPIAEVNTADVEAVLRPIWLTKAETAKRLRGRIEKVLDAAKAKGLRERESTNPAAWRGHLQVLLPSQRDVARKNHSALPWEQAPAFWAQLRAREALSARCLEFVILTVARSGEALGATWAEVDVEARTWTVPKSRMKARREHVVPLSDAAVALLTNLRPPAALSQDRIFAVAGVARSNMAMAMLLRRMERGDLTTHGFRSTFRDWAGDATEFGSELIELALAHGIKDKAEAAYRRRTAIAKRRELMEGWAEYLGANDEPY
jgi:integrase